MAAPGNGLLIFVCIASGPSLHPDDVDYCRGRAKVLCVNDAYRLAPWADYLYAADLGWWNHHIESVRAQFRGKCYTLPGKASIQYGLEAIEGKSEPGLGDDCLHYGNYWETDDEGKPYLESGQNSGFQALNLAFLLGAARVILLGYDMQASGKTHWFGDHPKQIQRDSPYDKFVKAYGSIKGKDIINCTTETALSCFPVRRLRDCL